jgi:microcystin degradation protein MlrC
MKNNLRIGIASVMQETNTWSPSPCTLEDFTAQGVVVGAAVFEHLRGTNSEVAGALAAVEAAGHTPVPIVRAWASSSGRVEAQALHDLCTLLAQEIAAAGPLDGLVLSLHGAMAADGCDNADAALARVAREALGAHVPMGVCLDLHANVTPELLAAADVVIGYRTYPHEDQFATAATTTRLVLLAVAGVRHTTVLAKRPMLIPAEAQSTEEGSMAALRRMADELATGPIVDISLFPVQPWLDVVDLGLGVTVTTTGDPAAAQEVAERIASAAWEMRRDFVVDLVPPKQAIDQAEASGTRPFLLSESADSPTAGAAGDSPAMLAHLLAHGNGLRAYLTVLDRAGVRQCLAAGVGGRVRLSVGASIEKRFHDPVELEGDVWHVGDEPVVLQGPYFAGMAVSMGAYAVVRTRNLFVLLTEWPAMTIDPATWTHVGLELDDAEVIVVRSATLFRAAYPAQSAADAIILDLPGASTPRLDRLEFERAPRPLFPVDDLV